MKRLANYLKEISISDKLKLVKEHIMMIYIPIFMCFIKWLLFAMAVGTIVGVVGTLFHYSIIKATEIRTDYPIIMLFLPIGGLAVVSVYFLLGIPKDTGTNKVLSAVRESTRLNPRRMVSVFISSVITHLLGGSSGREGAALQIGGSIGSYIGQKLKLDDDDCRVMVMCGMSAGFSALFGTPIAAAIFAIEVVSVGILHYSAIVPCMISSVMGYSIATYFGVTYFELSMKIVDISAQSMLKLVLFAALCGVLSWVCCFILKTTADTLQKIFKNPFIRAFVGGLAVIILTFAVGTYDYNGIGTGIIVDAFQTKALWYVFIFKLIFTAITLGSGYKGGEIVPVFFIGATFGSFFSGVIDGPTSFYAAIGMIALFCGVTNCPVTSILLGVELFGSRGIVFYGIACAISYMLSGYRGLYSEQRIAYSKLKTKYINKRVGNE
jgi:H+/Cl- antiporter ClcA